MFQRFFGLLLCCLPLLAAGQEPLRVGVVLSGGGAKGYAHVGALKIIEEAGVRIDYIGGASMGAIVGGLYAAGYSAAELDSILHSIDLTAILTEPTQREAFSLFRKTYGEKYAMTLLLEEGKINLPLAFSNGQLVYDLLADLTAHVATTHDFSQLPIPFYCTGTDVATGQSLIIDQGNLPLAMRASGAFPGLLAPVKIDGRLVADGGIINNFPVREMKRRGIDVVIGINVEDDLLAENELNSLEKILLQIGSYQLVQNSSLEYPYADVLVCPYTYGYGVTSFEAVDTLLLRGEDAARQVWQSLRDIAARQGPATPVHEQVQLPEAVAWTVDSVEVSGLGRGGQNYVLQQFPARLPGVVTQQQFRRGIANLYSTGNYSFINYQFFPLPNGHVSLHLELTQKPGRDSQVKVGLHYDDQFKSGLLLNFTYRNLLVENSIVSLDLILGDKFRYNLNYYADFRKKQGYGVNSRLHLNTFDFPLPQTVMLPDSSFLDELVYDLTDFSNEVYVHLFSSKDYAIGLASELKFYDLHSNQISGTVGGSDLLTNKNWYYTGSLFLRADTRNRPHFTTSGVQAAVFARAVLPVRWLPGDDLPDRPGYNLDAHFRAAVPTSDRLTLGLHLDLGMTWEQPAEPYRYYLGGNNLNVINNFKPFLGLPFADVSGVGVLMARAHGQYRFFENHYLTLAGNYASLQSTATGGYLQLQSLSLGYGLDSPLGPVELTYGLSNRGHSFYLNLGYWF